MIESRIGYTFLQYAEEVQYHSKTRYKPQHSEKYENTIEALDMLEDKDSRSSSYLELGSI
jgi:hypothetical protein